MNDGCGFAFYSFESGLSTKIAITCICGSFEKTAQDPDKYPSYCVVLLHLFLVIAAFLFWIYRWKNLEIRFEVT